MALRHHLRESLKFAPLVVSPWPRMWMCALGTTLPLLLGWWTNQLAFSIYGSLVAFLLVLNDIVAPLRRRYLNFSLTLAILCLGLYVGIALADQAYALGLVVFALTYFLGLLGAAGTEFERALLFAGFMLLTGAHSAQLRPHLHEAFKFALVGYVLILLITAAMTFVFGKSEFLFHRYRDTIRSAITREKHRHAYAMTYSVAVILSLVLVESLKFDHGYWAVGSILILMRPDTKDSVYRTIQRLVGTLIGAMLAAAVITLTRNQFVILFLITFFSFLAPLALARAYWVGSGFLTVMILLLTDLPFASAGSLKITLLRVQATVLGCALTLVAVGVYKLLPWRHAKPLPK